MANAAFDIDRLTPTERLDLIEKLWDSFSGEEVPVTEAQRQELERRLDTLACRS
jgi:putative addiction module component (TIGR02574 family)